MNAADDSINVRDHAKTNEAVRMRTHFRSLLKISVMDEHIAFDKSNVPPDVYRFIR